MDEIDRTGKKNKMDRNQKIRNRHESQTRETWKEGQQKQSDVAYRRRPRVVGVTEAVGEEEFEDRESWGEAEPNVMIEAGFGESVTDRSLFSSSLLLRETDKTKLQIRSVCLKQPAGTDMYC